MLRKIEEERQKELLRKQEEDREKDRLRKHEENRQNELMRKQEDEKQKELLRKQEEDRQRDALNKKKQSELDLHREALQNQKAQESSKRPSIINLQPVPEVKHQKPFFQPVERQSKFKLGRSNDSISKPERKFELKAKQIENVSDLEKILSYLSEEHIDIENLEDDGTFV